MLEHSSYIGGALKSPEDLTDYIFEDIAQCDLLCTDDLPEEFDLRQYSPPSRNQGNRGTCAAFSAALIKEIHETRQNGYSERISPEFIYYHRENKPLSGMWGRNVLQIMQQIGTVPESAFPYSKLDGSSRPNKELYALASQYRILSFARVVSVSGLRRALYEIGPCYLQLPLYSTRPHFWRIDREGSYGGGHAVVAVGYNKMGFIIKNSWGPEWEDNGCILFPYTDWDLHLECWVPINSKSNLTPRVRPKQSRPKKTRENAQKRSNNADSSMSTSLPMQNKPNKNPLPKRRSWSNVNHNSQNDISDERPSTLRFSVDLSKKKQSCIVM